MVKLLSSPGVTDPITVECTKWRLAVNVNVVNLSTRPAVVVKLADVLPCGTVTEAGTLKAGLVLLRATTTPPAGADAFKITRFAEELPPLASGSRIILAISSLLRTKIYVVASVTSGRLTLVTRI
jgi:hypothetical protein